MKNWFNGDKIDLIASIVLIGLIFVSGYAIYVPFL
jgi:hypothetical protein